MLPVTIDFETFGIEGRPAYPPKPVGLAIKWPGRKAKYMAWGHPIENNCKPAEAELELRKAWAHPGGVLMHNAKFDLDVAKTHFGMPRLPWHKVHDSMFLIFLADPHSPDMHLKSSAERLLDLPPEEQEAVRDWLLEHQPVEGVRIGEGKSSKHPWGKYIAYAPGKLVGTYAIGDVDRTVQIYDLLRRRLDEGMTAAYDRERRLLPYLLDMERTGVRVDQTRLEHDVVQGLDTLLKVDRWFFRKFGTNVNMDSDAQVAELLVRCKFVDERLMARTATGKLSMAKDSVALAITDKSVHAMLRYRSQLTTSLRTFMMPWLETAKMSGGLVYTTWRQIKSAEGGARTGRFSSSPNFQNVPKRFKPQFYDDVVKKMIAGMKVETDEQRGVVRQLKALPRPVIKGLPPPPFVRSYITPFEGEVLVDRDYSQQEYRILAHYDDGEILKKYHENPHMDFHTQAQVMVSEILGYELHRDQIKTMGFGLLYGMGIGLLASNLGVDVETATTIKKAYLSAVPGIKDMYKIMKELAANKQPLRTWGGRLYLCEPPAMVKDKRTGREVWRTFDYKMVNVLIQGSAADCTKEAIVRYMDSIRGTKHKLIITVHDELLASVPSGEVNEGMRLMKEAMESVQFDVPMLSEGKTSTTNWAEMRKVA